VGSNEVPRKIMDIKLEGCRRVGSPLWMVGMVEDLMKLGMKKWWIAARNGVLNLSEGHCGL
jgi:hypothetical protein